MTQPHTHRRRYGAESPTPPAPHRQPPQRRQGWATRAPVVPRSSAKTPVSVRDVETVQIQLQNARAELVGGRPTDTRQRTTELDYGPHEFLQRDIGSYLIRLLSARKQALRGVHQTISLPGQLPALRGKFVRQTAQSGKPLVSHGLREAAERGKRVIFLSSGFFSRIGASHGNPLKGFHKEGVTLRKVSVDSGVTGPRTARDLIQGHLLPLFYEQFLGGGQNPGPVACSIHPQPPVAASHLYI